VATNKESCQNIRMPTAETNTSLRTKLEYEGNCHNKQHKHNMHALKNNIGMIGTTFKEEYRNHNKSFNKKNIQTIQNLQNIFGN
jgi:hypothetical protein